MCLICAAPYQQAKCAACHGSVCKRKAPGLLTGRTSLAENKCNRAGSGKSRAGHRAGLYLLVIVPGTQSTAKTTQKFVNCTTPLLYFSLRERCQASWRLRFEAAVDASLSILHTATAASLSRSALQQQEGLIAQGGICTVLSSRLKTCSSPSCASEPSSAASSLTIMLSPANI